jgi:hypothetical protein
MEQETEVQSPNASTVEWLIKEIKNFDSGRSAYYNKTAIYNHAKAMEKEQRIKDYNAGYDDAQCNHINDADNYANEIEYLNNKEA